MNAIRVKTHIDSETLHFKEIKPLIGKNVEIIFLETTQEKPAKKKRALKSEKGWFDRHFGAGRDMDFDGFEETREKWRREEKASLRNPLE